MGAQMIGRRAVIAGAGATALLARPALALAREVGVTSTDLPLAVGSRSTRLTRVEREGGRKRGVVLFSTGHGSWPERYMLLTHRLALDGWVVLAPLHVDSMHHPDRASFSFHQSFPERLADMRATQAYAARDLADRPVIAAGHSFGTLTALCLGGALATMGSFRDPAVKAVLGFSTPGRIPGLIGPAAYAGVQVPVMIVTGTADTVPGFVTDPADHLFAAETVPTDSYALVVEGADHGLVASPAFARVAPAVDLFVSAYGSGDGAARQRLAGWHAAGGDRFTFRKATA